MRKGMCVAAAMLLAVMLLMSSALAYNTLQKNDSGSEVLKMQQALKALGYTITCDGKYGAKTEEIVTVFQREHGLSMDGIAGNNTLTLLYQLTSGGGTDTSVSATVYCENGGKLNLRSGAGSSYKVLVQIPNGTVLTVTDKGDKWCAVSWNGYHGYVMTSFLRFSVTPVGPTPVPAPTDNYFAVVYCADGGRLNLRASAGSSAKVLERIPNGTLLTVSDYDSKWCRTEYNGVSGYVMSSFLQKISPIVTATLAPATATPSPAPYVTATPSYAGIAMVSTENGGKLNLRASASATAKVLAQIPNGSTLYLTSVGTTWCTVNYGSQSGYVMTKFLAFLTPTAVPTAVPTISPVNPTPVPTGTTAMVYCSNGGKLNLRAGAGSSYSVLYQIPNKSLVTVLSRGSEWSQIRYGDYIGYVMSSFLRFDVTPAPTAAPTPVPTAAPTVAPGTLGHLYYGEYRYATVKTENGSLNLRKTPSTSGKILTELKDGAMVVISAFEGEWSKIYTETQSGYVMTKYLVQYAPATENGMVSSYSASTLARTLRSGYTGEDVNLTQRRLAELGYLSYVSGTYDDATISAVKNFQKQHGLTVDGYAGSATFQILFCTAARAYSTASIPSYTKYEIYYRDETTYSAVTRAQSTLRSLHYYVPSTSGLFDTDTHNAIVAFQLRNGVPATGVLDSITQYVLYSAGALEASAPARYYISDTDGLNVVHPTDIKLLHWQNEVKALQSGQKSFRVYDPATGLCWELSILSRGRHCDVEPLTLRDTLIMNKSFGASDWTCHIVYAEMPDGRWSMCTMHNRPHGSNTIMNNGFGGQNCVHFLRDMAEAEANDPSYGVENQKVLRDGWYKLTGERITK